MTRTPVGELAGGWAFSVAGWPSNPAARWMTGGLQKAAASSLLNELLGAQLQLHQLQIAATFGARQLQPFGQ